MAGRTRVVLVVTRAVNGPEGFVVKESRYNNPEYTSALTYEGNARRYTVIAHGCIAPGKKVKEEMRRGSKKKRRLGQLIELPGRE